MSLRTLRALMIASAVVAGGGAASAAPTLIGDTVTVMNEYPLGTVKATVPVVVGAGVEIACLPQCLGGLLFSGESIDIDALSITITLTPGRYTAASFNGFVFDDLDFGEGFLSNVSVTTSDVVGLGPANLSFDADTIRLNLAGVQVGDATIRLDLTVTTPGTVPEPGMLALVVPALALAGLARRRVRV